MKKNSAILLLICGGLAGLILTATYGWTRRVQAMGVRFNAKDIKEHGLEIVGPLDSSFEKLASAYFKGKPNSRLQELKPFSVFLKNGGNRELVAYVLRWDLVRNNGFVTTSYNAYSQPGVLMGYGVNVRAGSHQRHIIDVGGTRLFSLASPIDPDDGNVLGGASYAPSEPSFDPTLNITERIRSELPKLANITVSLDGAFFADGTFVGPNTSGYFEHMKAEIDAKRDLLARIAKADKSPSELDRAWEAIQLIANREMMERRVDSTPAQLYEYYSQEFAREIIGLKDTYGAERAAGHFKSLHNLRKPVLKKR